MEKNLFTFVERNDSNKQFENHLSTSATAKMQTILMTRIHTATHG